MASAAPAKPRNVRRSRATKRKGNHNGTSRRVSHHRDGRHRPGAVRRHAARRHGCRGDPRRPSRGDRSGPSGTRAEVRRAASRPPLDCARRQGRGRARRRQAARGQGRRADRGLPTRRHGASRAWPRRASEDQPQARLRPHDRLRPGRAAVPGRRPRHQLHRARRRAACHRPQGRGAGAALEPRRRFRRRRHVSRLRRAVRAAGGAEVGQGPGGGCRHGRRRRLPVGGDLRPVFARLVDRRARRQLRRHGRALVRRVQDQGRQMAVRRRHREALLRGAGREAGLGLGRAAQAARPQGLARSARALRRDDRIQDARRVGARLRGQRRLRRPRAVARRGGDHPHNVARATFCDAMACCSRPRHRASPARPARWGHQRGRGADTDAVLRDWGFAPARSTR